MRFEFRIYRRTFKKPLRTHHGEWLVREGLIVRLIEDDRPIGWGEIAPIAAFGTESLEQALQLCQQLTSNPTVDDIFSIPPAFPACQFGLGSAYEMLTRPNPPKPQPLPYSGLLPAGAAALSTWPALWEQGTRTFKWKIGVAPIDQELPFFAQLIAQLPAAARLRLDANGGLSWSEACTWLEQCDRLIPVGQSIGPLEFIEQPLPHDQFEGMLRLSQLYQTPIALDESVTTLQQLECCYRQGWRGLVVVKAALAGYPQKLRDFCQQHHLNVVWSSVFETSIAQQYIFNYLIPSIPSGSNPSGDSRAIGFGIHHWFEPSPLDHLDFEHLWQSL